MPIDQETFNLLKGFWIQQGGAPGHADLAASIAFAESAGCQWALAGPVDIRPVKQCTWNRTNGENSAGYWQINLRAHPSYSAPSIFNPAVNASAAIAISKDGSDFGAWSTYVNGAYKPFLAKYAGQTATGQTPPPAAPPDRYPDTATIPDGVWNTGWEHLTKQLSHTLPNALTFSQHTRERTLRTLAHRRKVVR